MFRTDLYVQIGVNRVRVRNVDGGANVERLSKVPFSHPRMLVGNFTEAQALVKAAVAEAKGSSFFRTLRIVMHPTEVVSGGLAQVEDRVFRELALGAGAAKVVVWVGIELGDEAVKAKLVGN